MTKTTRRRRSNRGVNQIDRMRLLAEAERAQAEAREQFFAFRQYVHPNAAWNWFTQDVAQSLQRFYEDFVAGRARRWC